MKVFGTLAALGAALAPAVSAQATYAQFNGNAQSLVVVQTAGAEGGGVNNAIYLPPAADNNYAGVVNLWFRNSSGTVLSGCTGSLLSTRQILSAAHCVTNPNTNVIRWTSFTARFRNADGTFTEVNGTGFATNPNYSGAVIEEQDVAVLTLGADAPAGARTYSLFNGNPLVDYTLAGFGRTGDGATGDANTANNQFGAVNVLRAGRNSFETTGIDGGSFATGANPARQNFGGILLSDFDRASAGSTTSFMCASLAICTGATNGARESAVGRGDSGGAAFSNTWEVLGVASWGQGNAPGGNLNGYNAVFGYSCVANFASNAGCQGNYDFVMAQLAPGQVIPEPSTYALMATGLIGLAGFARRRRS